MLVLVFLQPEGLNRIASWNSIGGSDDDLVHNGDKVSHEADVHGRA